MSEDKRMPISNLSLLKIDTIIIKFHIQITFFFKFKWRTSFILMNLGGSSGFALKKNIRFFAKLMKIILEIALIWWDYNTNLIFIGLNLN